MSLVEEEGYLAVNGASLAWRRVTPAGGAALTLVLLHEGLGAVSLWRDFPERLAEATGAAVFAWSRAGYGASSPKPAPWPLTYLHDEGLAGVAPVLDAAGIGRHVLIGHSDGASIAVLHAGTRRDPRLAGVVLLAPHVVVEPLCVAAIARVAEAYGSTDLRARLARHHGAQVDDVFQGWSGAWLDPLFATWDIRLAVPSIPVPVLVIQGDDDEYGTDVQPDLIQCLARVEVRIALLGACGHAPHRDQPDQTLALIAEYLRRVG